MESGCKDVEGLDGYWKEFSSQWNQRVNSKEMIFHEKVKLGKLTRDGTPCEGQNGCRLMQSNE